jgi:cyclopropane fatty-acyl-phospholipid synthase-like methyltransferase
MQVLFFILLILSIIVVFSILYWYYSDTIIKSIVLGKLNKIRIGTLRLEDNQGSLVWQSSRNTDQTISSTITVNNERAFFRSIAFEGEIGLGKAYSENVWNCDDLLKLVKLLILNVKYLGAGDRQSSHENNHTDKKEVQHHYDVGNDFYESFLRDSFMAYSCGFWFTVSDTLETAQRNKVNTIMNKLQLKQGERVLDIGCGWGKIGNYIAKASGAIVDGVTISSKQAEYIRQNHLLDTVYEVNYIDLDDSLKYDKIYSIGMMEHVRCINYKAFFDKVYRLLKPNGRLVLHTIIENPMNINDASESMCRKGAAKNFVTVEIFPGGHCQHMNGL